MEENKHPVLTALNEKISELLTKITELEDQVQKAKEASRQRAYDLVANEEKLQAVLTEGINDSEITHEFAQAIADIFGIELTEEVEMELTFKVQATFTVPIGFDTDELASEIGIKTEFIGKADEYLNSDYWELDDFQITS